MPTAHAELQIILSERLRILPDRADLHTAVHTAERERTLAPIWLAAGDS
jgi:hypothetical protein